MHKQSGAGFGRREARTALVLADKPAPLISTAAHHHKQTNKTDTMKTKTHQPSKHSALTRIQKQFPQVTKVRDSKRTIEVTVEPQDSAQGRKKDPQSCALARACVRTKIADAAIIGLSFSWLIKGDTAIRYKTSTGVGREITSFDRHHDFASGKDYKLSKIAKSNRLGKRWTGPRSPHASKRPVTQKFHHTANVRIISRHA